MPAGSVPPTQTSGGSAETPTTLPSIVRKRLEEAQGEEGAETGGVASADAVFKLSEGLSVFMSGVYE